MLRDMASRYGAMRLFAADLQQLGSDATIVFAEGRDHGTLFQPGFSIEGPAAFAIATDRYIRDSEDDQIVEDPVVADTLYLASEDITARRDERVPLYSTEVMPSMTIV